MEVEERMENETKSPLSRVLLRIIVALLITGIVAGCFLIGYYLVQ